MADLQRHPSTEKLFEALATSQRRTLLAEHLAYTPKTVLPVVSKWNQDPGALREESDFDAIRPLPKLLDTHRDDVPGEWI